jgi:hypothetical protein
MDGGPKLVLRISRAVDLVRQSAVRRGALHLLYQPPAEQSTTRKLGTQSPVPPSPACYGQRLFTVVPSEARA